MTTPTRTQQTQAAAIIGHSKRGWREWEYGVCSIVIEYAVPLITLAAWAWIGWTYLSH